MLTPPALVPSSLPIRADPSEARESGKPGRPRRRRPAASRGSPPPRRPGRRRRDRGRGSGSAARPTARRAAAPRPSPAPRRGRCHRRKYDPDPPSPRGADRRLDIATIEAGRRSPYSRRDTGSPARLLQIARPGGRTAPAPAPRQPGDEIRVGGDEPRSFQFLPPPIGAQARIEHMIPPAAVDLQIAERHPLVDEARPLQQSARSGVLGV